MTCLGQLALIQELAAMTYLSHPAPSLELAVMACLDHPALNPEGGAHRVGQSSPGLALPAT